MRWTRITDLEIEKLDSIESAFAIRLYLRLKLYAGNENYAWPTQARLAKEMGVSKQTMNRGIRKLESCGLLKRERTEKLVFRLLLHPDKEFDQQMYHMITSKRSEKVVTGDYPESSQETTKVVTQVDSHKSNKNNNTNIISSIGNNNLRARARGKANGVSKRDKMPERDELLEADLLEWYPDLPKGLAIIAARWLDEDWCMIMKRTIEDSPVTRNPVAVFVSKLKDALGGNPKVYNMLRKTQRDLSGNLISHDETITRIHLHDDAKKEERKDGN